jgi:hypothetical protein
MTNLSTRERRVRGPHGHWFDGEYVMSGSVLSISLRSDFDVDRLGVSLETLAMFQGAA